MLPAYMADWILLPMKQVSNEHSPLHWSRAHTYMFGIAINKLFEWLFSRVLSSHCEGPGLIPSQDMSVLGTLVKDKDDFGLVSSQRYKLSAMERVFIFIL